MIVLTDEEIKEIPAMMATDTAINFARAVESAVLEKLKKHRDELLAAQAREAKLREVLHRAQYSGNPYCETVRIALEAEADDTALRELIASSGEAM